jgi:hypothetical protein
MCSQQGCAVRVMCAVWAVRLMCAVCSEVDVCSVQ